MDTDRRFWNNTLAISVAGSRPASICRSSDREYSALLYLRSAFTASGCRAFGFGLLRNSSWRMAR